jgi:polyhydroxyalkanoate synthesis regulator phasin
MMPRAKSSTTGGASRAPGSATDTGTGGAAKTAAKTLAKKAEETVEEPSGDGLSGLAEDLANRVLKPLDLVLLSRERIQATLDDAAERGRVTRGDANELVAELLRRGRQQTDDLLGDVEGLLDRGREQLESATKLARRTAQPVDRLVRGADRARRSMAGDPEPAFPITGYDELTVGQVTQRLPNLTPPQLRHVRDYERRHANRKSVLAAIEKQLG